jgi:hypothetical protein
VPQKQRDQQQPDDAGCDSAPAAGGKRKRGHARRLPGKPSRVCDGSATKA